MQQLVSGHRLFQPTHPLHLSIVDIHLNAEQEIEITASKQTESNKWVCGGFCEPFAQFGDPAQLHKESFESYTQIAKEAGYVSVAISPETKQIRDQQEQIEHISSKSSKQLRIYPYAALTLGLNNQSPSEMYQLSQAGALGFSNGNSRIDDNGLMVRLLQYTSMIDKPVIYTPLLSNLAGGVDIADGEVSILTGWEGNPYIAETMAIQRDISLLEYYGGSVIWNKISSKHSIPLIKEAKQKGLNVAATASIHNLAFNESEQIGLDPYWKVYPTLRSKDDQVALQNAVLDGTIDAVVSDHQPQDYESKEVEFEYAEYGAASQEFVLPILFNLFGKEKMNTILEILNQRNFKILGLKPQEISPDHICCIDLDQEYAFTSKSKGINPTPFQSDFQIKAELI